MPHFFCPHCQRIKDRKYIGLRHPSGSICTTCLARARSKNLNAKGDAPWFGGRHGHNK